MDIFASLSQTFSVAGVDLSVGDALGLVTGTICVWLTARAHILNFPFGILNSLILGVVFLDQRLFADASLQIVFIVLSIQGWIQWMRGSKTARIGAFHSTSTREQMALSLIALVLTVILWQVLLWLKGAAPPLDALITALSLCAQWQLNRRQISSWAWWIAVDLVSIPLYWSRDLPLIACLYALYLLMCLQGWWHWRKLAADSPKLAAV
jgi:nicotinamide mononucleotide transporter